MVASLVDLVRHRRGLRRPRTRADATPRARTRNRSVGRHSEERVSYRNGYRSRGLNRRVGSIELAIPKLRSGSYFSHHWQRQQDELVLERGLVFGPETAQRVGFSSGTGANARRVSTLGRSSSDSPQREPSPCRRWLVARISPVHVPAWCSRCRRRCHCRGGLHQRHDVLSPEVRLLFCPLLPDVGHAFTVGGRAADGGARAG